MKYKYNFIYETLLTDGHYYIGQHHTDNLNDGYIGSGTKFNNYIKEHNVGVLSRTILKYCKTQKEMNKEEKSYISAYINDPLCLNETISGWGDDHLYSDIYDIKKLKKDYNCLYERYNKLCKFHNTLLADYNSLRKDYDNILYDNHRLINMKCGVYYDIDE